MPLKYQDDAAALLNDRLALLDVRCRRLRQLDADPSSMSADVLATSSGIGYSSIPTQLGVIVLFLLLRLPFSREDASVEPALAEPLEPGDRMDVSVVPALVVVPNTPPRSTRPRAPVSRKRAAFPNRFSCAYPGPQPPHLRAAMMKPPRARMREKPPA